MNVSEAVAAAKKHLGEQFAGVDDLRMEEFVYDDHLGVWSITLGFAAATGSRDRRVVRVSEADKTVLSVSIR